VLGRILILPPIFSLTSPKRGASPGDGGSSARMRPPSSHLVFRPQRSVFDVSKSVGRVDGRPQGPRAAVRFTAQRKEEFSTEGNQVNEAREFSTGANGDNGDLLEPEKPLFPPFTRAGEVRERFKRVKPLKDIGIKERGWTLDMLNIVRRLVDSRRRGDESGAAAGERAKPPHVHPPQ